MIDDTLSVLTLLWWMSSLTHFNVHLSDSDSPHDGFAFQFTVDGLKWLGTTLPIEQCFREIDVQQIHGSFSVLHKYINYFRINIRVYEITL